MILVISSIICYWDIAKVVFYCPPKEVLIRRLICQILLWKLIGQMMNENLEETKIGSYGLFITDVFCLNLLQEKSEPKALVGRKLSIPKSLARIRT